MNNLLSVNQVAFILKVHPLTIRRYIKAMKLKAIKVGGNVRIQESDLQDFQKDVTPSLPTANMIIQKSKKFIVHSFAIDDPILRLQGRGASLNLSESK
jgi:excisionase family DNA binding protein